MCETVMLNEHNNRYPTESLYHHPFDYDSDEDYETFNYGATATHSDDDDLEEEVEEGQRETDLSKGRISQDDIDFFKGLWNWQELLDD